ncbi:MAG TPA: helix-turn-helix transcriptional regulator [Bradyrhizobium sp.]|jgi:DNA-binding CsgD family transcriptional regulator|uniref:helix-turn-helix transcriptional regulator n=1 Tax=Bradyrhizobium sp. TaxID=376 RepID=UPI002D0C4809|nr:helix-turn-helix transcriptional regulator [Bradyrhizobium sp.]HTA99396.1 helix-turn-helix transcriptional regulator [Bradyrhizobium sp.]
MSRLVDRIYECAFVPDLWPEILAELAHLGGALSGWLCISNGSAVHWSASSKEARNDLRPLMESGWITRSERFNRLLRAEQTGFISDSILYTPEERRSDPAYRDLLHPRGMGWASATAIALPTGDDMVIALERAYDQGSASPAVLETLNEVHCHLARASFVAARMQLERARAASQVFALLGIPALVFADNGKILAANQLIETLSGFIAWRAKDQIALMDACADALLRDAIAMTDQDDAPSVRSFPLRNKSSAMIAHVVPIRGSARDVFSRCAAMLMLTPVTRPEAPSVELIRSLFDLTPAEARVARGLAAGQTVKVIAAESGTSTNTVHTHVNAVLAKTGYSRQSDVVALLNGLRPPGFANDA